ncbi:ATP-binding protein [Dyadobacter sp. 676]|uniref:histidine kinase n=1 Tax=Dyadobacter sp. 676 TaxID=3088362 RepID=A0AAU8FHX7_9BACT
MTGIKIKYLLGVGWLMIGVACYGQQKSFTWTNYTTQEGLPQNSVTDIDEDALGFIWFSTEMGLVRFDGKNFKVFGLENTPGLATDRMRLICRDRKGVLYAHEAKPAVLRIAPENHRYAPVPKVLTEEKINIPTGGYAVAESVFNPAAPQEVIEKINRVRIELAAPRFYGVDSTHAYILYNKIDLFYVSNGQAQLLESSNDKWSALALVGDSFMKIFPQNRIKMWRDGRKEVENTRIQGSLSTDPDFLNGDFKVFWSDTENFVYCSKKLHRLYWNGKVLDSRVALEGLDIPGIKSVYYSKGHKTYFIGSETNGLFVIRPSLFTYPALPPNAPSQVFYSQALIDSDKIFAQNIIFSENAPPRTTPYLVHRESVSHHSNRKHIIYYERARAFYSYDFRAGREKKIIDLDGRLVATIEDTKDSTLYLFTNYSALVFQNGLLKYQASPGHFTQHAIRVGGDQFLLCTENGVKKYNLSSNITTGSILDSLNIRTVFLDKHNRLWISSNGSGFYMSDGKGVYAMPMDKRRALRTVHSFIDDGTGHFWLPSNDGLFRVSQRELVDYAYGKRKGVYYYLFNKSDGLKTTEFNGGCDPSYLRLPNGMLSLPSLEGLVWFHPGRTTPVLPDKPLSIDQILINGKRVNMADRIVLEPDFSRFEMSVTSPFFGNEDNILIEYQIPELNQDWFVVQPNRLILINNLRSGNYRINIRKKNGSFHSSYDYLRLGIEVKPYHYNTWWFYLLMTIVAVGMIYVLMLFRFRMLRKKSEELELLISARTQQLSDKVAELNVSENTLKETNHLKDKIITLILHDLRSPIRFLTTISNYLSKECLNLTPDELKTTTSELKSGTMALNNFTDHFFTWISSHRENFSVSCERVSICALYMEVKDLYEELAKNEGNEIMVSCGEVYCYTDRYILGTIIRNLVDNANKNMRDGLITLSATAGQGKITLCISDTGKGLPDEQISQFNKGIVTQKGIGFVIVFDLMKKIGAHLTVSSGQGSGSAFTLSIPLVGAGETVMTVE